MRICHMVFYVTEILACVLIREKIEGVKRSSPTAKLLVVPKS
jgi:hypothetical protein